ncbi:MAG: M12 family metallopeptidase [Gammaproteobacteria bacterium]
MLSQEIKVMGFGVIDRTKYRWVNGVIPYEIDTQAFPPGSQARTAIDNAINHWNSNTVIKLIPRLNSEADYVVFEPDSGKCFSSVGRQGGGKVFRALFL